MAIAGPATSFVLGQASYIIAPSLGDPLAFYVQIFGRMNVILAIFNMLPLFPLDGGRVLRSILAILLGQRLGTRCAAAIGIVGCIMLPFAMWKHFDLFSALWVALIVFYVILPVNRAAWDHPEGNM